MWKYFGFILRKYLYIENIYYILLCILVLWSDYREIFYYRFLYINYIMGDSKDLAVR